MEQIEEFDKTCGGNMDFTIGSALDIFGGHLPYDKIKNIK